MKRAAGRGKGREREGDLQDSARSVGSERMALRCFRSVTRKVCLRNAMKHCQARSCVKRNHAATWMSARSSEASLSYAPSDSYGSEASRRLVTRMKVRRHGA